MLSTRRATFEAWSGKRGKFHMVAWVLGISDLKFQISESQQSIAKRSQGWLRGSRSEGGLRFLDRGACLRSVRSEICNLRSEVCNPHRGLPAPLPAEHDEHVRGQAQRGEGAEHAGQPEHGQGVLAGGGVVVV